jgi:glutathione S-transferase
MVPDYRPLTSADRKQNMAEAFVLFGSPHSQFTYKVALMLRLSGTPFSFRYVSFQKGMHRTPEFRALSRWGQVPVLKHGERVLVQSGAILEYLAEILDSFAGTGASRQRIREWLFWDAHQFAPPIYGCYGIKLGKLKLLPIAVDPAVAEGHRRRAKTALSVLDGNLGHRDFLAEVDPTIADLCCYGETAFAQLSDFDLGDWPNVKRWTDRLSHLAGFASPFDLLTMADAEVT